MVTIKAQPGTVIRHSFHTADQVDSAHRAPPRSDYSHKSPPQSTSTCKEPSIPKNCQISTFSYDSRWKGSASGVGCSQDLDMRGN